MSTPHWSTTVEWRPGRWDPMSNAPVTGYPILRVRGRDKDGKLIENMHYAEGGGEEQPPFKGWFVPAGERSYSGVDPVEWQPMNASPTEFPDGGVIEGTNRTTSGAIGQP